MLCWRRRVWQGIKWRVCFDVFVFIPSIPLSPPKEMRTHSAGSSMKRANSVKREARVLRLSSSPNQVKRYVASPIWQQHISDLDTQQASKKCRIENRETHINVWFHMPSIWSNLTGTLDFIMVVCSIAKSQTPNIFGILYHLEICCQVCATFTLQYVLIQPHRSHQYMHWSYEQSTSRGRGRYVYQKEYRLVINHSNVKERPTTAFPEYGPVTPKREITASDESQDIPYGAVLHSKEHCNITDLLCWQSIVSPIFLPLVNPHPLLHPHHLTWNSLQMNGTSSQWYGAHPALTMHCYKMSCTSHRAH